MLQYCWKFRSQNVQTYGYVFQDTNDGNHGPVWKIQLFLLNGICMVILQQDCCQNDNIKKFYSNLDDEKKIELTMTICSLETRIYPCRSTLTTSKCQERNRIKRPCGKIDAESWSARIYVVFRARLLVMHSTWMQINWHHYWRIHKDVRITYFCCSNKKLLSWEKKTSHKNNCMILRHGRTCSEIRGKIQWIDK